jgi:hypothetical protein
MNELEDCSVPSPKLLQFLTIIINCYWRIIKNSWENNMISTKMIQISEWQSLGVKLCPIKWCLLHQTCVALGSQLIYADVEYRFILKSVKN